MDQSRPTTGLPRQDVWMSLCLLAIMGAADIAAAITGLPDRARPLLIIMPGSLALVWACYAAGMAFGRSQLRKGKVDNRHLAKMGKFMGHTQVLMGSVLTVAHIAMLGSFTWFGGASSDLLLRAFMAAIGAALVVSHNRMPKAIGVVPTGGRFGWAMAQRVQSWAGVLCGAGMIAVAFMAPTEIRTTAYLTLAFLPTLLMFATALIVRPTPKT